MASPTLSARFASWISGVLSPQSRTSSASTMKASPCFASSPMLPSAWLSCSISEVAAWFDMVARRITHKLSSTELQEQQQPPQTQTQPQPQAQHEPQTQTHSHSHNHNNHNKSSTIVTTSNSKRKGAGKKVHQLETLYKISAAISFKICTPEDGPDFVNN